MSEIAACTLIQEEPDRKTERYLTMFKDYPDVVTVEHLQERSCGWSLPKTVFAVGDVPPIHSILNLL